MTTPGIEKLAELAHASNDEKYRLEVRVIELEQRVRELDEQRAHLAHMEVKCDELLDRISKAREILESYGEIEDMKVIRGALDALEGK